MIGNIVLIILGVILLILFCPIHFVLRYVDGKVTVKAGIPFLHFRIYPDLAARLESDSLSQKQKRKLMKKLLKKKAKAEKRLVAAKQTKKKPKHTLGESMKGKKSKGMLKDLSRLFRVLRVLAGKFGKKLHIKIKRLEIVAGSDDAAKTAYLFGAFSQALAYGLAAADCYSNIRFRNSRVSVRADFCAERSRVDAEVLFRIRVIGLLSLALSAVLLFAKETMNHESSGEPLGSEASATGRPDNIQNKKGISA